MKSLFKKCRDRILSPVLHDLANIKNSIEQMSDLSKDISTNRIDVQKNLSRFNFWLDMHEKLDGNIIMLSPARRFQLDETQYDIKSYGTVEHFDDCFVRGESLLKLLAKRNIDCSSPIWEIGCGTGALSLGILYNHDFPSFIISDISTQFIEIVKSKIEFIGDKRQPRQYCYAVYDTDNQLNKPPNESISVIVLQATLHHVNNPDKFIHDMSKVIVPGGAIVFAEPCREGNALVALLCKFYIEHYRKNMGIENIYDHIYTQIAQYAIDAVKLFCRQDIDKSNHEDKHLFIIEHIMDIAKKAGLDFEFIQNKGFENFEPSFEGYSAHSSLEGYCRFYFGPTMGAGWGDEVDKHKSAFVEDFCRFAEPFFNLYNELCAGTIPPSFCGVFILKRCA